MNVGHQLEGARLLIELRFQIGQHFRGDDGPQGVVEIARRFNESAGGEVRQKRARRRFDRRLQMRTRSGSEQRGQ